MTNIIINGKFENKVTVQDRAFQYGDGLFETIAFKNNKLVYWNEHLQRLNQGSRLLGLDIIPEKVWLDDVKQLVDKNQDLVIKLIYSRGNGQRGYRLPDKVEPLRVVMASSLPEYSDELYSQGVKTVICKTPASINSKLAGIKHLNRLENVMARSEWSNDSIFEGIMCDDFSNVIEGTMSNLFAVKNNSLYTPILKRSGVAGIIRQKVIDLAKNDSIVTQQIEIKLDKLLDMDEIFITNSLIGLMPVNQVDNNYYAPGPVTRHLMQCLEKDTAGCEL